jgi:BASS family bile acid:Na+ symporter
VSLLFESYPLYEHQLASAQLAFAMLGMGALLSPRDFVSVVTAPRGLLVGLGVQLLVFPLLASVLGRVLPLTPGIAVGLVLVAAVPGGTMSNVATYFARGSIALSIALTAITTVGSLVMTPLILRIFVGAHLPPDFEMPTGRIAYEIGVTLLVPLGLGMLIGTRIPDRREGFSRWSIRASLAVIGLMVIGAGGSGRLDPESYGAVAPLAIFLLAAIGQLLSLGICVLSRVTAQERVAIGIEATIRNTNLGILIKASLFPAVIGVIDPIGDGMFFVALLYGGMAIVVALPLILVSRRRHSDESH